MTLIVNAWLERTEPLIQLIDVHTGKTVLKITSPLVQELFESAGWLLREPHGDAQTLLHELQCCMAGNQAETDRLMHRRIKCLLACLKNPGPMSKVFRLEGAQQDCGRALDLKGSNYSKNNDRN